MSINKRTDIQTVWYIYLLEYHLAVKKNELLTECFSKHYFE